MKKNKTLSLALILTMLLLPFANTVDVSGIPPPSYVGVSEGDIITWEVDLDGAGITDFATDIDSTATSIMNFIADDTSTGLEAYIEQWIPNSMLNQNLTAGICELLENITSGSILPEGWADMDVPKIITDMINASIPPGILPVGWLDTINCSDFICSLLDLALSGLPNWNQSWTGFNVTALLDLIFETVVDPTGYFEDGWLDSYTLTTMFDMLLLNLTRAFENASFLNGWTDFNISTLILTVLENLTAPVMPDGWLDTDIKTMMNAMLDSGVLTSDCLDLNISECIRYIISNLTSDVMPAGWMDLSLSEILDTSLALLESVTDPELLEILESLYDILFNYFETVLEIYDSMSTMYGPVVWIDSLTMFPLLFFQDYSIFEILDSYIIQMGRSTEYKSNVDITEIVGNYGIKTNTTIFSDDWIGATIQIYDFAATLIGTFTISSPILRNPPDCTLYVDSTGLTQTLTEMGVDDTCTFSIMRLVENPIRGITIGEFLNSSLDLMLPTMPFTLPSSQGGIITSVENATHFSVGPNPQNQSWVGGVAYITYGAFMYVPVTSVTDNGTHVIVGIQSVFNLYDYVTPGFDSVVFYGGSLNLTTASIRNIITETSKFVFSIAGTLSISDLIDWVLTSLNMTMPYLLMTYGIDFAGDFLSLSVRESIYCVLQFFNKVIFNPIGAPIAFGTNILEITGDFNFTVSSNPTNNTWSDGFVFIYSATPMAPMQYFKITNVIDNGDNITIAIEDQAYTLTEMGYGPGNSTNFYGPRFLSLEVYFGIKKDIFNVTLNDLIGLIPLLNTPASDLVFSVFFEQFVLHLPPGTLSMYTVREIIGMYFYYLETATSSWFYTGDIQIWSDSINTLTGDFSFTTLNDYSGDVNGLIGGSVSLNSNSFEHEIINAVDLGAIIEITLAPYSYNNLTDLGYSGGESAIFYAPSYIFDLNFLDGTLHGLIHEIVGILNYTAGTYIPFLNIFMDIDSTQWDALSTGYPSFHDLIEYLTVLYYIDSTIQLRVVIDTIGEEMIIPYYGITGTPINISMKFSIDTENWIDIPVEILSLSNAIGLNCDFFIIDPSTTPGEWFTAFPQQIGMSYGLIMANSYDWADFNTEETIPAGLGLNLPGLTFLQDLEEISFGISWTANGILDELVINYGGEQIARIGSPAVIPTMNIPGFDLPILIGISAIGAIGVIYIVMKKKRI